MRPSHHSRHLRLPFALLAVVFAVTVLFATSGTASAYQVLEETGLIGPYSMSDTSLVPGAVCAYERVSDEFEYLRWMKVKAPQVWAADRNSEKRESRVVSWRFELQKNIGPGYSTVGKSPVQRALAYEDQPAPLTAKRVYFDSEAVGDEYIAQVTIKWHKRDGSVEGKVRLRMQFYGNKTHPGTVHEGFCPGGAQYV